MSAEPPGRAARPEAASSVAHGLPARGLPASLPQNEHRTPTTSNIPPNPPRRRRPAHAVGFGVEHLRESEEKARVGAPSRTH
jgi:hypothetical protein